MKKVHRRAFWLLAEELERKSLRMQSSETLQKMILAALFLTILASTFMLGFYRQFLQEVLPKPYPMVVFLGVVVIFGWLVSYSVGWYRIHIDELRSSHEYAEVPKWRKVKEQLMQDELFHDFCRELQKVSPLKMDASSAEERTLKNGDLGVELRSDIERLMKKP